MGRVFPPSFRTVVLLVCRNAAFFAAVSIWIVISPCQTPGNELPAGLILEEEVDLEEILSDLPTHLDIDTATKSEIIVLPMFSPSDASRFIAFRDSLPPGDTVANHLYGDIGLEGIQAFILQSVASLYADSNPLWKGNLRTGMISSNIRSVTDYKHYTALNVDHNGRIRLGVRFERDPGEPKELDYLSGHLVFERGNSGRVIVGDFRTGFGQGLLMSRSSRSYVAGTSVLRRKPVRMENTSWEESGFLRGAVYSSTRGKYDFTVLASDRRLDATLDDNGNAVTIRTAGLHRYGERGGNLTERVAGANISRRTSSSLFSLTLTAAGYNPSLARKTGEQYLNAPESSTFMYISADGTVERPRSAFFYEAVGMSGREHAVLAGMLLRPKRMRLGFVVRDYSRGYWAYRAASLSSFGSVSNERGMYVAVQVTPPGRVRFDASMDIARTQGRTHLSLMPVSRRRLSLSAELKVLRNVSGRVSYRSTHESGDDPDRRSITGRVALTNRRGVLSKFHGMAVYTEGGNESGAYGEAGFRLDRGRFRLEAGGGVFGISGYSARFYRYEQNVPGRGFTTPVWGNGHSVIVVGKLSAVSVRYKTVYSDQMNHLDEFAVQGDWTF